MRIGILEAGEPPPALVPAYGTYDSMTRRMIGDRHAYAAFRVFEGHLPSSPSACDAFVVTGAAAGVYDGLPWIAALEDFLRDAIGRAKLIGICFGHQIMARAFGGIIEKAPQGWGVGLHRYDILERARWMDAAEAIHVTASHQDQVLTPPPRCRVLGASAFTPHAILAYTDHPSISFQFHPEFAPDFSRALLGARRAPDLTEAQVAAAVASLDGPNDNRRLARRIDAFLQS